MTRLLILATTLGIGLSILTAACETPAAEAPPEWDRILRQYQALGEHRSGTMTDRATGNWLRSELQARGVDATTQDWPLRLFQLKASYIEAGGETIEAFPFWFPTGTGTKGIGAPLANGDEAEQNQLAGSVALFRLPPGQIEMHYEIAPVLESAAARGALAAIVTIDHPIKAVSAQNSVRPWHQQKLPLPALIASKADAEKLLALAAELTPVRVVVDGTEEEATAANVIGKVNRNANQWVVISTPISGWFEATNERGPGIALLLQLAQWAVRGDSNANFLFIGLSGHELGQMGMEALANSGVLPRPDNVRLWVHLGSGIAVQTPLLAAVSSTSTLSAEVEKALVNTTSMTYWPEENMPKGSEQYRAMKLGYPVVGLFGADPAIHTRADQEPRIDDQEYNKVLDGLQELIRSEISNGSAQNEDIQ